MPIINYKPALISKVIDGSKPHTIRFGKRIYKVGQTAIHATGSRTKHYLEHRRDEITQVEKIRIKSEKFAVKIWIDDQHISECAAYKLAANDGFKNFKSFIQFFRTQHGSEFDLKGQLIHWAKTPINYKYI